MAKSKKKNYIKIIDEQFIVPYDKGGGIIINSITNTIWERLPNLMILSIIKNWFKNLNMR